MQLHPFMRVLSIKLHFIYESSRPRMIALGNNQWTLNGFSFIPLGWMACKILNECFCSAYHLVLFMVMLSRNNAAFAPRSLDRVVSITYKNRKVRPIV